MTSSAQRVLDVLTRSRFAALLTAALPKPVAETLRDLGKDVGEGRSSALAAGDVNDGDSVRAVNVVKGTVVGGNVRAVNLLLGDVLGGELRAVNVLVGTVRGGKLKDVNLIVGDVYGGHFERCYAVIGNVYGGSGKLSRVIGEVHETEIEIENPQ